MIEETSSSRAIDALYWRSEILQALFWMRGEGLADAVTPDDLARFLGVETPVLRTQMARLEADGYLETLDGGGYGLTDLGRSEGGRSFADEFRGLTQQAHGECSASCWCNDPQHSGDACPSHPESPDHVH